MDTSAAIRIFEALSSAIRLDVFRLLVERGPGGMVAGEIAAALAIPSTNLSFHLKVLVHAGLATVVQEGRYQRYRANLAAVRDVTGFLTEACCNGAPEACPEVEQTLTALGRTRC